MWHNFEVDLLNYFPSNVSYNIKENPLINLLVAQCDIIEKPTFIIAHHLHKMVFTKLTYL